MIEQIIKKNVLKAIKEIFNIDIDEKIILVQRTKKEFTGDFTLVVFPFVKLLKKSPEIIANELGEYLKNNVSEIADFNVIKGFLNFVLTNQFWFDFLESSFMPLNTKSELTINEEYVIEYSSPNTNKPLHLGHIRNNLLGYSIAKIIIASEKKVTKVNLINDRGIHICKSMLAYKTWGKSEVPTKKTKGDKLVGDYYVIFDRKQKAQIRRFIAGYKKNESNISNKVLEVFEKKETVPPSFTKM